MTDILWNVFGMIEIGGAVALVVIVVIGAIVVIKEWLR